MNPERAQSLAHQLLQKGFQPVIHYRFDDDRNVIASVKATGPTTVENLGALAELVKEWRGELDPRISPALLTAEFS